MSTAVLVIGAPIADGDVPLLCERLRALAAGGGAEVVCDAGRLAVDVDSVEALARLALTARRCGCRLRLVRVPAELGRVLRIVGLAGVVGLEARPAAAAAGRRAGTAARSPRTS